MHLCLGKNIYLYLSKQNNNSLAASCVRLVLPQHTLFALKNRTKLMLQTICLIYVYIVKLFNAS